MRLSDNLRVMNKDGKVYTKKYDKFKQINKFLEIVDDSLAEKNIQDGLTIIDSGCGKSISYICPILLFSL